MRPTKNADLTHDRLIEVLDYNAATGIFTWRQRLSNRALAGAVAGTTRKGKGYVILSIDGRLFYGHRLAWFYVYGIWPEGMLDHADRNASNNAIRNLRPANYHQNAVNKSVDARSRTGLKGVWLTKHGRFAAYIGSGKTRHYLGTYSTASEAHEVYRAAAKIEHGEFCAV